MTSLLRLTALVLCGSVLVLRPAAAQDEPAFYEPEQIAEAIESTLPFGATGQGNYGCECQLERFLTGESLLTPYQGTELGGLQWYMGGEVRFRHMNEDNRLRPGGPAKTQYDLWRFTGFLEARANDNLSLYVQGIDANIHEAELPVTAIDKNRWDLLQYYVDARIGEVGDGVLRAKVGRQFLKYGSQHLVSPLGWANTFRNFEGINLYYRSNLWDIDGFVTRPVNGAAGNIFRPRSFDHPDASRTFSGIYSTYKGIDNGVIDLYWLLLNEDNDNPAQLDGERHTVGIRYAGTTATDDDCGFALTTWNWDVELGYQFGRNETLGAAINEDIRAGFVSAELGHTWNQVAWKPTFKGVFYWASGDDTPGNGTNYNFSPLFPLGHAYWGIIDNLNGSNLLDYSPQLVVHPTGRISLTTAFHFFLKDESTAPIFNVAGAPLPAGGPGTTAKDIGEELDLIMTWKPNESAQVQLGYSWFWYGDAVDQDVIRRDDATQLYLMVTQKF